MKEFNYNFRLLICDSFLVLFGSVGIHIWKWIQICSMSFLLWPFRILCRCATVNIHNSHTAHTLCINSNFINDLAAAECTKWSWNDDAKQETMSKYGTQNTWIVCNETIEYKIVVEIVKQFEMHCILPFKYWHVVCDGASIRQFGKSYQF